MKQYIILDIDNCIANDAWRIPYIDWAATNADERYYVYHSLCSRDTSDVQWLKLEMAKYPRIDWSDVGVFALTARPTSHTAETKAWLALNLPVPLKLYGLLTRNVGDHRHSVEVKRDQLNHLKTDWSISLKQVLFAADDRQDVLAMYRESGLTTIHHAIHDVCAYTPPPDAPKHKSAPLRGVPLLLTEAAETFASRNGTYGDNYRAYGPLMASLFPRGLTVVTPEDWGRLAIVMSCANKLSRYTWASNAAGDGVSGHRDSARDLIVFAAMLEELTP